MLRVAEVEAVDQRHRPGPGAGDVAGGLQHGQGAAGAGVEEAEAGLAVGGEGQRLVCFP